MLSPDLPKQPERGKITTSIITDRSLWPATFPLTAVILVYLFLLLSSPRGYAYFTSSEGSNSAHQMCLTRNVEKHNDLYDAALMARNEALMEAERAYAVAVGVAIASAEAASAAAVRTIRSPQVLIAALAAIAAAQGVAVLLAYQSMRSEKRRIRASFEREERALTRSFNSGEGECHHQHNPLHGSAGDDMLETPDQVLADPFGRPSGGFGSWNSSSGNNWWNECVPRGGGRPNDNDRRPRC